MLKGSEVTKFLRTVLDKDASFKVLSKDKIVLDKNQQTAYFVKICYANENEYCTVILLQYPAKYLLNGLVFNGEKENATRYFKRNPQEEIQRENFRRNDENGQLYWSFLGKYELMPE